MKSLWSGSLSFGLIYIPVRLYSADSEQQINFDLLHKKDLSPIRYARVCKADGKEIPYEDIVKGYEYRPGDYVVLTDKDFEKVLPEKTKTIQITDFTYEKEIDPLYFEKPYYLEPDKGAVKAYVLLREALAKSGVVALANFVFRQKEHVGMIKPYGHLIILNQMRYHSTLRKAEVIEIPPSEKPHPKEVEMALKLIEQLTVPFKPEKYKDTYHDELKKMIEQRTKGRRKKSAPKPVQVAQGKKVVDLMAMLKASLEEHKKKAG